MATINYSELVREMLKIAKVSFSSKWKEAEPYAKREFKSFSDNIKLIAKLKAQGKINEEQARLYLEIQKSSMRVVLLTIEGLGIIAVETAINGAINAIKKTVNRAIGWVIL